VLLWNVAVTARATEDLVPTLCVGNGRRDAPRRDFYAQRQGLHSYAERGNEESQTIRAAVFSRGSASKDGISELTRAPELLQ